MKRKDIIFFIQSYLRSLIAILLKTFLLKYTLQEFFAFNVI